MASYEAAGKAYIDWCANMAESLDVGIPWIMCQQDDAPQPMVPTLPQFVNYLHIQLSLFMYPVISFIYFKQINTCNGFYCDSFTPNNPNSPKMWTENWTGWLVQYYYFFMLVMWSIITFMIQELW